MINGAHTIIYSKDAEKLRAFFRDVLEWNSVDAGHGWLIFELPPGEIAVHPVEGDADANTHELYLMCDDIHQTVAELKGKGVELARDIAEMPWGLLTAIKLPDGGEIGLYEPRHPTALSR
ncbi:MAG: VOC family protein [Chthoniobacterales bacterium]